MAVAKKARPTGRPSNFNVQVGDDICERLADGESLRSICRDEGMPGKATVFRWLQKHESFRDQYTRARESQADALFDEILDIADEQCTMVRASKHGSRDDDGDGNTEVVYDTVAVQRNRLRIDARKWMAGKMRPKVYGDKPIDVQDGEEAAPVPVNITVQVQDARKHDSTEPQSTAGAVSPASS